MKGKWKTLLVTSLVILAPIIYGVSVYNRLPARMVTHWGFNNQPNGWMVKPLLVFGLPCLMLLIHLVAVGATYYAGAKGRPAPRMERVVAWIFPVITIVAYTITIRYGLGEAVDIRLWTVIMVAAILIFIGNYLPTVPPESVNKSGFHLSKSSSQSDLRSIGYCLVLFGVLTLLSLFFPAILTVIVLVLFIISLLGLMLVSYRKSAK
ncbi:DUF1648 domain-containing protein [Lactobacillus sp. LC28-10]|uniref:DUF1648 domain-containing protein n=1 Tax=Secundilactobacillus angelensis TaxID=2722706 RepID=A0ABX1L4A0_9LACO|nr:DUF1648 domain-containing protein [Secundilactobacillus angelensis]MCH5462654.1 DUF1648 domain-containing protein [Secundilactobacillus angelensis]NLR19146.1 DUF1648 domain-containing protein [Secundilactobacillus angelensis]